MAKVAWADKVNLITKSLIARINKVTAADMNETKQSINTLYDIVGAGSESDNKIVFSINSTGDLADLIDGITDASSSNRYSIELRPGVYTTKPITWKPYIFLKGNDKGACIINATNTTDTVFTMASAASISNVTVQGASSGIGFSFVSPGFCSIKDITLIDCDNGIVLNNSSSSIDLLQITGATTSQMTNLVNIQSGNATITKVTIAENADYNIAIKVSGINSLSTISSNTTFSSNLNYGIHVSDGAKANAIGNNFSGGNTALYVTGNDTVCIIKSSVSALAQQYGIHVPNDGTTPQILIEGVIIQNSGIYDAFIENPNCILSGDVSLDLSNSILTPGADINLEIKNQFEGDKGTVIIGESHTGSQSYPSESVFGEGDSHVVQKVYTKTSGNVFTDVTSEASSVSGSNYSFPGVTAENAIYISNLYPDPTGSPSKFYGVKVSIETAADLGTGNIIAEYWNGAWNEFNASTSLSGGGYLKYAKNYFNQIGNYHIKFDPSILDDWIANDPVSLGTDFFWVRFRIDSDITTSPVLQQNKISPNRSEKNPDGTDEYHGLGRTIKKLSLDASGPILGNMQNSDIFVDENIGVAFVQNRFTSVGDVRGYSFELPEDCDTSGKLILVWKGRFASTGNAEFTIRLKIVKPGDAYTNSNPIDSGEQKIVTTGLIPVTANVRQDFRVDIDISDAIPSRENGFGDEIWVSIQNTTRSGNFDIAKISANYLSDFNGRHLNQ